MDTDVTVNGCCHKEELQLRGSLLRYDCLRSSLVDETYEEISLYVFAFLREVVCMIIYLKGPLSWSRRDNSI